MDRSEAENARRQVDEWIAELREEAAQREAEQAASANADHAPVVNPGDTTPAAAECPPDPEPAKLVRAELSPSRAMLGTGLSKTSSDEEQVSRKDLKKLQRIVLQIKVLPGENQAYADRFVRCLLQDLEPRDGREMILACRFISNAWELRRLSRFKDELRRGAATHAFVKLMGEHFKNLDAAARAERWRRGRPRQKTRTVMKKAGFNKTAIVSHGIADNLDLFQTIDLLEARLEARTNSMLHEFDRHRESKISVRRRQPILEAKMLDD
jgi:hypothetical protein